MRDEVIEKIPPPEMVREQLGRALRETTLLRRLLRVSELKEKQQIPPSDEADDTVADARQEASR